MSVEQVFEAGSSAFAADLAVVLTTAERLGSRALWEVQNGDLPGLLRAAETATRMLDAARLRLIGEVEHRGLALSDGAVSTGRWVADVTGTTPAAGVRAVATATALARWFPATGAALAAGSVSVWHAERLLAALDPIRPRVDATTLEQAEAHLLALATTLDARGFIRACATMVTALDPDGPPPGEDEDPARRNALRISEPTPTGMRRLSGWLDDTSAAVLLTALTPLAAPGAGSAAPGAGSAAPTGRRGALDRRGAPRRMADALVALARIGLAADLLPAQGGARPAVTVTVSLETLTGATPGVATLDWGGPIDPATARLLACDARVIPVVLGGQGQPLDVGRERRTVPTALRRALTVRDAGCAYPGCGSPPGWCDAHHITHWASGGDTSLGNLVLLCGPHHRLTHHSRWDIEIDPTTEHPRFRPPRHVDPQEQWRPSHNTPGRLRT